jgi:hypothetical protein
MNNKCSCFSYGNVDDLIFDTSYRIIDGIIYSAKFWTNIEDVEIPEEKKDEWHAKLWNFDITEWKPRSDDRAFPNTKYDNRLRSILECKAYDLKDEIMDYLKTHKGSELNEKKNYTKEYVEEVVRGRIRQNLLEYHEKAGVKIVDNIDENLKRIEDSIYNSIFYVENVKFTYLQRTKDIIRDILHS